MADQPAAATAAAGGHDALPQSVAKVPQKAAPNPALRMMGIPNFRLRLPSRNWLIFLSITGSFTTALLYDRYHKRKAQRRWCKVVSHLAEEPLPTTQMPRTIAIFLSAPPGDGLRAAREHFHEYIKPILVAGAVDWEVIEGRHEGEVRAGRASKIRRIRRRSGETVEGQQTEESTEDRLEDFRRGAQIRSFDGVQGDLVLGRHTWKEYIRGLHEGWIGPLESPEQPNSQSSLGTTNLSDSPIHDTNTTDLPSLEEPSSDSLSLTEPSATPLPNEPSQSSTYNESEAASQPPPPSPEPEKPPEKSSPKLSPTPPYILPSAYSISSLATTTPSVLPPATVLSFPHLLGFLNTPIRIYRFLNRRHLADETGRAVAALVLARDTRSFERGSEFFSSEEPDDATPAAVVEASKAWEQESILVDEEAEWHKSAWAPDKKDSLDRERPWQESMTIDERLGTRMRTFELAKHEEEERISRAVAAIAVEDREKPGRIHGALQWLGLRREPRLKGWEMGLTGTEDD